MNRFIRMLRAVVKYPTARAVWGYLMFSLVLSLVFVYASQNTHWVFIYTLPFIFLALLMGYISYKTYMGIKALMVKFYREEMEIQEGVADVSKPYRRGALYLPEMIPDIVDGVDIYRVFSPFLSSGKMPPNIYHDMLKYVFIGERVFWMTLMDMVRLTLVDVGEEGEVVLKLKNCASGVSPVISEVCDVLKKASVREKKEIDYDKEVYVCALRLTTLNEYLSEVDINLNVGGGRRPLSRMQHVSILLYEVLIGEFRPPTAFDKHPPIPLPLKVSLVLDRYKSTYSLSYFMSTLAWAVPYFSLSYFAFLAAVVGFATAYLYVPSGIFHPSIPWYNRYRVWSYMRHKVKGIYPERMSVEDALLYIKAFSSETDHFLLAVVLGEVEIAP